MFSEGTDGCDITDNPMTIECQQQRRKARAKVGNAKAEPKRIDPKKHSRCEKFHQCHFARKC